MSFDVISPSSTKELLKTIKECKNKNTRFAAGCTDVLLELRKYPIENLTLINLTGITDPLFRGIRKQKGTLWLGAGVTASSIISSVDVMRDYPVLRESAAHLASTQIREVATLGGNVCTASPSGDMACALVALRAECVLLKANGKKRQIPISEFFTGPRHTKLSKSELLYGITLPTALKNTHRVVSGFIKIGTRRSMECSVVSLAYHLEVDANNSIVAAGAAIGAAAPTIRFTGKACEFLLGKVYSEVSEAEANHFAKLVVRYAQPISDIRGTAWYRKEVLFNISKSIFEQS